MPINNLMEFILYILPGFITRELYLSQFPVKERNNFSQISWSILYGVLIMSFVKWCDKNILNYFLCSNSDGFPEFKFILVIIFISFIAGYILILINNLRFKISNKYEKFKFLAPDPQSIWVEINKQSVLDWAVIFLNDGSTYIGWISSYSYNPNLEYQDFLLSQAKCVDENLKLKYLVNGIGVYLNTKDVKRIEFVKGTNNI